MPLTEEEELELLELEEEEANSKGTLKSASNVNVPQQPKDKGYLQGIGDAWGDSWKKADSKIDREAQLTAQGKQSGLAGAGWSMLHNVAGGVEAGYNALGAALKPVTKPFTDYASKINEQERTSTELARGEANKGQYAGKALVENSLKLAKDHPDAISRIESGVSTLGALPMGNPVKSTTKLTGEALENTGKSALLGEMKITKSMAQKATGKNLIEQKKNIVNDIQEFGLQNSGNFQKMSDKADALISKQDAKAKSILADIVKKQNAPTVNPADIVTQKALDLAKNGTLGQEDEVLAVADKILNGMKLKGYDKSLPLDELIDVKKQIKAKSTFKYGPGKSDADILANEVRKEIYGGFLDEIESISPELREIGKVERRLFNVRDAAADAASRVANRNLIGLTEKIAAAGALGGGLGLHGLTGGASDIPLVLGTIGGIAAKKSLEQGRGAGALITIGSGLKKMSNKKIF